MINKDIDKIMWFNVNVYFEKYKVNGSLLFFVVVYFIDIMVKISDFFYKDIV